MSLGGTNPQAYYRGRSASFDANMDEDEIMRQVLEKSKEEQ